MTARAEAGALQCRPRDAGLPATVRSQAKASGAPLRGCTGSMALLMCWLWTSGFLKYDGIHSVVLSHWSGVLYDGGREEGGRVPNRCPSLCQPAGV